MEDNLMDEETKLTYIPQIANIFNVPLEKIHFSDKFFEDRNQNVAVFEQILHLSSLYDLRNVTTQRVMFKSDGVVYGKVESDLEATGQNLTCINFGDSSQAAFSNGRFSRRLSENAIDKVVVTHEFAHVLSGSTRAAEPVEIRYWQELAANYWQPYQEFAEALAAYDELISIYSLKNIDDFHAEAFTECHLSEQPCQVARDVGKLIDKYFRKSKNEE